MKRIGSASEAFRLQNSTLRRVVFVSIAFAFAVETSYDATSFNPRTVFRYFESSLLVGEKEK